MDELALATRLISRQMDEVDPIPGHYTLEVTSPGLERQLRTAAHFQREVGKAVTVRLADPSADPRRIDGHLVSADERTATLLLDSGEERVVDISAIDKAAPCSRFGPKPKPGTAKPESAKTGSQQAEVGTTSRRNATPTSEPSPRQHPRPHGCDAVNFEQGDAIVMSNLDMSEAIGLLAEEKGLSEDALLHVLVDALGRRTSAAPTPPTKWSSR